MEHQLSLLVVEVDSTALVHLLQSFTIGKWPLCNTLPYIRRLLSQLSATQYHIYRDSNATADKIASLGLGCDRLFTSMQQLPSEVCAMLNLDSISYPL